jgi:hypothetical protein
MSIKLIRSRYFRASFDSWKTAGMYLALIRRLQLRYVSLLQNNPKNIVYAPIQNEITFLLPVQHLYGQGDFLLELFTIMLKKEGFILFSGKTMKHVSEDFGFELMEKITLKRKSWRWFPIKSEPNAETISFSISIGHDRGRLIMKHNTGNKQPRFTNALGVMGYLLEKHAGNSIAESILP